MQVLSRNKPKRPWPVMRIADDDWIGEARPHHRIANDSLTAGLLQPEIRMSRRGEATTPAVAVTQEIDKMAAAHSTMGPVLHDSINPPGEAAEDDESLQRGPRTHPGRHDNRVLLETD